MIDPGLMVHQLTIQQETRTRVAGGDRTTSWGDIATDPNVFGRVRPLQGSERFRAQAVDSELSHEVTIYYRSDVTAKMAFLHEGRRLVIVGPPVDPEEQHRYLLCYCSEDT